VTASVRRPEGGRRGRAGSPPPSVNPSLVMGRSHRRCAGKTLLVFYYSAAEQRADQRICERHFTHS